MAGDPWAYRPKMMRCKRCMHYVEKQPTNVEDKKSYVEVGRCRRHAPIAQEGYPVVFPADWCGDFRLDENKL